MQTIPLFMFESESIQNVAFNYNEIEKVELSSSPSHFIESLSLRGNRLTNFSCKSRYRIRSLDGSDNNLKSFQMECQINEINLSGNMLETLKIDENVRKLNASNNNIQDVVFVGNPTVIF